MSTSAFRAARLSRAALLVALGTGALAAPAASAGAQSAPSSERLHAPAQTVWARRGRAASAAALQRLAALRTAPAGAVARAAIVGPDEPVAGTLAQVAIPLDFPDEVSPFTSGEIQERLYGTGAAAEYSVSRYYDEISNGVFQVVGNTVDAVTMPRASSYYVGTRRAVPYPGIADHLKEFVLDALQAADAATDWSALLPDGQTQFPAVVLLTAGPGGQCVGDKTHMWPHRFSVSQLTGKPFKTHSVTAQGDTIVIDDYIVQGVADCDGQTLTPAGVVVHETGHLLGLPDLYATNTADSRGPVGNWDLMATGNYSGNGSTPARLGAWTRFALGWAQLALAPEDLTAADTVPVTLPAADDQLIYGLPMAGSDEYVLLENRVRRGSDQGLPGEGMLAWYVNPSRISAAIETNSVNNDLAHPGVAVIQADGLGQLQAGQTARGDAGDVWPGAANARSFTPTSRPAFVSLVSGAPAGFALTEIGLAGDDVTFRLSVLEDAGVGALDIIPAALPQFVEGDTVKVVFSVADTLTQGDSLTWSVSGNALTTLGLRFNPTTGTLSGVLRAATEGATLTVTTTAAKSHEMGSRTYTLVVIATVPVTADEAIAAVLSPETAPLFEDQARWLDAIGNQNGRVDLGDLVRAARRGKLAATPDTLAAAARRLGTRATSPRP